MRSSVIALVVLLLTAGCIGVGGSTEDIASLEDQARDRANERVDDPQLVAAFAIEPPRHDQRGDEELWTYLDDEAGDGRAPGWVYIYEGVDRVGAVAVAAEVGILAEAWTSDPGALEELEPLEAWEVTSSEAADALADHEDWPALNETHAVFWTLEQGQEGPYWDVSVERALGGWDGAVYAVVDASTGDVLSVERRSVETGPVPDEHSMSWCDVNHGQSSVTPVSGAFVLDSYLPEPGTIVVQLEHEGVGVLEVEVLRDGEVLWETSEVSHPQDSTLSEAWDGAPGTYELRARTPAGAVEVEGSLVTMVGECGWETGEVEADVGVQTHGEQLKAWAWEVLGEHVARAS